MEQLVSATLPHGLAPKVVPEFRHITVGGAIMGGAMESGSFMHGMFHDTVYSCELLYPNGSVAFVSRTDQPDLLAALGGSYGTLATVTAATIECVRLPIGAGPPRIELNLEWHADVAEGVEALSAIARARAHPCGRRIDFLDAVALPRLSGSTEAEGGGGGSGGVLVCAARLAAADDDIAANDEAASEPWEVSEAGAEFYYEKLLAVGRLAAAGSAGAGCFGAARGCCVSMDLEAYFFRHDRGAFQIGTAALWLASWRDWLTPTKLLLAAASARRPLNFRALCDPLFETGTMYSRLHLAPPEAIASRLVLQDR